MKAWLPLPLVLGLVAALQGCASTEPGLEGASTSSNEALAPPQNRTYFTVRPDLRRCMYPMCGGAFVARVNRPYTRCADGSWARECYVADLDLTALDLDPATESEARSTSNVLLRGEIREDYIDGFGSFGRFVATEAWKPASDSSPRGSFFRATDSGVRCFTTPCDSIHADALNRGGHWDIAEVDLGGAGASADRDAAAQAALGTRDGVLVAGGGYWVWGPAGWGIGLYATQYFLPFERADCVVSGCSSQICSDDFVYTTCEWREEYACYRDATCERQADGACGWTATPELEQCLDAATGRVCGTRGALPCGPGELCLYPESAQCGWADAPGTCERIPEGCIEVYEPVCGCDGTTYGNACLAHAAGTSVQHGGECCTPGGPHEPSTEEITGRWSGTASWDIEWSFAPDGTFEKSDLVAPCPPDAVCIWSGVVENHGEWTIQGAEIALRYESPDNGHGAATPDRLSVTETCDGSGSLVLSDGVAKYEK